MSQPNSPDTAAGQTAPLPYAGIRVVEFTHMVMGPSCGMMLADLGAEVIKIEPPAGDSTRHTGPAVEPGMAAMFMGTNLSLIHI